ncbi:MAG: hypothetical protein HYV47_03330 [Candidatus Nealsonbacteria bacterium]|nr:hypothetical protein [Candidatus Nealsonbacteria bacterium]
MTKRVRTIIFVILVFLFAVAAPSAIFYSQGYRVDFGEKKIVQTGGLYFKVSPSKVEVHINGKFKKNTSLITNTFYIENLLPKTYKVEIKKDGYHAWIKTLEVKEKEVTEAKNIILFPKNPQFSIADKMPTKIINSATSTDKEKVLESNNYEIWVYFAKKDERIFLTRFSEKIVNIFWLNDYYLIFNVGDKIKIAEIDNRDGLNIIDFAEFKNPRIVWDKNTKELYISSEGILYKTSIAF